ncbi:MAG: ABC transporter permease [Deltaproteobacteria bacterium]
MRAGSKIVASLIFIFIFTGIFHDFIANEKPLICIQNGKTVFPVFKEKFRTDTTDRIILMAPVRYSHYTIDMQNTGGISPFGKQKLMPGQQRHLLGTDIFGRDVLAGLIFGTSVSLKVGIGSMLLAFFLGLIMSLIPSYFGDNGLKIKVSTFFILAIILSVLFYLLYYFKYFTLAIMPADRIAYLFLLLLIIVIFSVMPFSQKSFSLPLDTGISLFTGVFQSLPSSFLVLILISLFTKTTILHIILVIGFLKWPSIARYVRTEVIKVRQERFVEASRVLGLNDILIIIRHVFPYTLTPVFVALTYGFAGSIMLESTLSFLGIGTPADHVSWGTMLGESRQDFSAWWLAVFPGMAIFMVTYCFNAIGEKYSGRFQ